MPVVGDDSNLAWPTWQIVLVAVGGGIGLILVILLVFIGVWCNFCQPGSRGRPSGKVAPNPFEVATLPPHPGIYPMGPRGMKMPDDMVPAKYGPNSNQPLASEGYPLPVTANAYGYPVPYFSPQAARIQEYT